MFNYVIKNRNKIFFVQCLIIHAAYAIYMANVGMKPIAILNVISSMIYLFIVIRRRNTETGLAIAYFEILAFSMLCEVTLGYGYGFYLFSLGMAASLFYLIPSFGKKRFVFQVLGVIVTLGVEMIIRLGDLNFPLDTGSIAGIKQHIFIINLAITLSMVVEMGVLYATENDEIRARLKHNMNHDPLTDLYNRRYFGEWTHANKLAFKQPYAVAMIDIDDFKKINDNYGHSIGDEAIVQVSTEIKNVAELQNQKSKNGKLVGYKTIPVRWGGEEFIIFFPNKSMEEVKIIMDELRCKIAECVVKTKSDEIHLHVTIGVADGKADSNYEHVINRADQNLYIGKRNGKNCIVAE